jgi:hypothetical protein
MLASLAVNAPGGSQVCRETILRLTCHKHKRVILTEAAAPTILFI